MKKIFFSCLIVIVFTGFLSFFSMSEASRASKARTFSEKRVSCFLFSQNGTWKVLDNETHDNDGCIAVDQTDKYIKVAYPAFTAATGSAITGDNKFAQRNMTLGASVGQQVTLISIYKNGKLINPKSITDQYSNISVYLSGNGY
jgi:hypothetical protein